MYTHKMLIGGELVDAESGRTYPAINPANGEEIALAAYGDREEVNRAVQAARDAFPVWSRKTQEERSNIISQIAGIIVANAKELAQIESLNHGFPIKMAIGPVQGSARGLELISQMSKSLMGAHIPARSNALSYVKREPVGVCGLIVPWNVPFGIAMSMMGSAIAVGNTCVLKPSSINCLSALKLGELLTKTDLPPGVVNIVTGSGDTVGEAMASHSGITQIGFTGSTETGKAILSAGSSTVKRMHMKLGGKNPFIVLDDADIDAAVDCAVFGSFFNSGMICASPGRYYVHEKIHDEFVDKFVAAAKNIIVGDPSDERTQMGPVVSSQHRDQIEAYIKSGLDEGAKIALGGVRPSDPPLDKGFYVPPTIFTQVTQDMKIAREEVFGPVACIIKHKNDDEAIRFANDTRYGLCTSVWTKDISRGIRFTDEINAGTVWVNEHGFNLLELPWGGFKESGLGKSGSTFGVEEYTQLKAVYIDLSGQKQKMWHRL